MLLQERKKETEAAPATINKELLFKVARQIRSNPESFSMDLIMMDKPSEGCGTVGCIAGWTICLGREYTPKAAQEYINRMISVDNEWGWIDEATKLLKIPQNIALNLFVPAGWPEPYSTLFYNATTKEERAKAAADLLEDIATCEIDLARFMNC